MALYGICRMCSHDGEVTRHHLLLRKSRAQLGLTDDQVRSVTLCRPCHDRLHKGAPAERAIAHAELRERLSPDELQHLALKPRLEWWELNLARAQ